MSPRRQDEYDVFEGFGRFGRIWINPGPTAIEEGDVPPDTAGKFADRPSVDRSAEPPDAAPDRRPRMRRGPIAVVGALVAAVLTAVLVSGSGDVAPSGRHDEAGRHDESGRTEGAGPTAGAGPAAAATSARPVPPARAPIASPAVPRGSRGKVVVLDQSAGPALADGMARRLEAAGWEVTGRAVFHGVVPATTVYHPLGQEARARALSAAVPGLGRIRPAFAGIPLDRLTVIVVGDRPAPPAGRPGAPGTG